MSLLKERAKQILTKEYLQRHYEDMGKSGNQIAAETGISVQTVFNYLHNFGIEIRPNAFYHPEKHLEQYTQLKYLEILTPSFLEREYIERQRSANKIAKALGIPQIVVIEYLKRHGFEIRSRAFYSQGDRHPNYGKPFSDMTKLAMSQAKKGKYNGSNNPFYGRKHTLETRQLISDHHADFSLENHPRWQGGKSFEPYGFEFDEQLKESIRQRDNHTCQLCGVPERECFEKLHCHHIDYDKENCLPSNLISLCRSCHSQTNNNRDYWIEYFSKKLLITA